MKLRVLILVFPFAVFLSETAILPLEANPANSKISCTKMKETMEMKCHSKKDCNKKPSGKCNNTSGCYICPVCSIFTFLPQYEWSVKCFSFKKNYRLINTGNVSSYITPVWKPPNSYILYS